MTTHPEINHLATDERIRAIAYSLWEEEGRPEGRAEFHWLTACGLVAAEAVVPDWLKREEPVKPDAPVEPAPIRAHERKAA